MIHLMVRLLLLSASIVGSWSHGFMTRPQARQKGASNLSSAGTVCGYCSCCWYTNRIAIPGKPTICDKDLLTVPVSKPCSGGGGDWTRTKPWRAPGTAPISSPCGMNGGTDGAHLPPRERLVWKQGSTVEVAMAITANHGGGYVYRLCPAAEKPTEACFQAHTLAFVGDMTKVQFMNGSSISIPVKRTTQGTTPAGSQWTRNPIPGEASDFPIPFPGGVGSKWKFSLVDKVKLPASLALGDYLVSWRWDCEKTPQTWTNCGDVTIVADGPPSPPAPPAPPAPTPTPPTPAPPPTPSPPTPAPPAPPAPTPSPVPKKPTCCWSNWGTTCNTYPKAYSGGRCNTDPTRKCDGDSDCRGLFV